MPLLSGSPLDPSTIAGAVKAARDAEKAHADAARDAKKTQRAAKQAEEFQGPFMSISTAGTVLPGPALDATASHEASGMY